MQQHTSLAAGILVALLLALAPAAMASNIETGKGVYRARCAFCHGMTGRGDGTAGTSLRPPPTDFTRTEYWEHATSESIKAVIENGRPGTGMLAFKETLSEKEIAALLAYLDTFKPAP
jgi:mono/diheme cytochrome c family protein